MSSDYEYRGNQPLKNSNFNPNDNIHKKNFYRNHKKNARYSIYAPKSKNGQYEPFNQNTIGDKSQKESLRSNLAEQEFEKYCR